MSIENEKWVPVPGFEGAYEASDFGRVRSMERIEVCGKIRRKRPSKILKIDNGRVRLCSNGTAKNMAISELIQTLFPEKASVLDREGEKWLPIPGFEGLYEVSNLYRVRRITRIAGHRPEGGRRFVSTKIINPTPNNGYLVVHLWRGSKKPTRKFYVEAEVENLFPDAKPSITNDIESLPNERWLPITGYEGLYEISDFGRVKSLGWYVSGIKRRYIRPRVLVGSTTAEYPKVELANKGTVRTILIHRLVAMAFVPNPLGLPIVHHKDENRSNSRFDNLEWTSNAGNIQDWFDRRRIAITPHTIDAILAAGAEGKTAHEILALLPRRRKKGK